LNRSLEPKASATQAKFDDAQKADANAANVAANPQATADDRKKALEDAQKAREAFEESKREYEAAKGVVIEQRRGVRAKYEGEVADAGGDKQDRLKREREKAEKQREKERRDAQDLARDRLEEVADDREVGLDASARSRGLRARDIGNRNKNETLQTVGKALADGTDAGELQKLGDLVREKSKENGKAVTAFMLNILSELQTQVRDIETIKSQIKNLRNK
jgi:hypothetical protein